MMASASYQHVPDTVDSIVDGHHRRWMIGSATSITAVVRRGFPVCAHRCGVPLNEQTEAATGVDILGSSMRRHQSGLRAGPPTTGRHLESVRCCLSSTSQGSGPIVQADHRTRTASPGLGPQDHRRGAPIGAERNRMSRRPLHAHGGRGWPARLQRCRGRGVWCRFSARSTATGQGRRCPSLSPAGWHAPTESGAQRGDTPGDRLLRLLFEALAICVPGAHAMGAGAAAWHRNTQLEGSVPSGDSDVENTRVIGHVSSASPAGSAAYPDRRQGRASPTQQANSISKISLPSLEGREGNPRASRASRGRSFPT